MDTKQQLVENIKQWIKNDSASSGWFLDKPEKSSISS